MLPTDTLKHILTHLKLRDVLTLKCLCLILKDTFNDIGLPLKDFKDIRSRFPTPIYLNHLEGYRFKLYAFNYVSPDGRAPKERDVGVYSTYPKLIGIVTCTHLSYVSFNGMPHFCISLDYITSTCYSPKSFIEAFESFQNMMRPYIVPFHDIKGYNTLL